jgi:hypothetical protein
VLGLKGTPDSIKDQVNTCWEIALRVRYLGLKSYAEPDRARLFRKAESLEARAAEMEAPLVFPGQLMLIHPVIKKCRALCFDTQWTFAQMCNRHQIFKVSRVFRSMVG